MKKLIIFFIYLILLVSCSDSTKTPTDSVLNEPISPYFELLDGEYEARIYTMKSEYSFIPKDCVVEFEDDKIYIDNVLTADLEFKKFNLDCFRKPLDSSYYGYGLPGTEEHIKQFEKLTVINSGYISTNFYYNNPYFDAIYIVDLENEYYMYFLDREDVYTYDEEQEKFVTKENILNIKYIFSLKEK